jgi:hypothetical protein
MRRLMLLIAGGLLLVSACHKKKPPVLAPTAEPPPQQAPPAPPPAENLTPVEQDARLYYDDEASAFPDSIRMVIRDAESLTSIWAKATSGQASAPPIPAVDFTQSIVLLVGAGKMRTGDQIHVDSVGTRQGRLVVVVRTTVDCQSIPNAAYPFEIVRVKRSSKPVSFVERRSKGPDCQ